ncbi:MAG: hypothetical protein HYW50_01780 [Candidatus Diapherotrites archaeon]|nr:hypothetical protein [Candidatus Diapherotrites archaeon]
MLKVEQVWREVLFGAENGVRKFTQKGLAQRLGISLTNVNHALGSLKKMHAVKTNPMNFELVNPKKVLLHWASVRNLEKDIVFSARVEKSVTEIEKTMPEGVFFTAYSGYKFRFNSVPADYSQVYVYAENFEEIRKRFAGAKNVLNPNLFVLQADQNMKLYGKIVTSANLFVDLWNLPHWYAKDFFKELEERLHGLLE